MVELVETPQLDRGPIWSTSSDAIKQLDLTTPATMPLMDSEYKQVGEWKLG